MNKKIAVIGLGYVGLPLAVEFSKVNDVFGFDLNLKRISELREGYDATLELDAEQLASANRLKFTNTLSDLAECNVYIITVPTPVDDNKQPDLSYIVGASEMVGGLISTNDVVIFESTVFPGATEDVCAPIIENESGLKFNVDFFLGYSPERINPGDKKHGLTSIVKVTSGSNEQTSDFVDSLYASIIEAGTYKASSIKVAEAAKVIENTQRDLNIALVNELAIIFDQMNIDTSEVLAAARTKWNFLDFRPGLVGGHCIGVDPYYLTYKAQQLGYEPEVILAGRKTNDGMGKHIANSLIKEMLRKKINLITAKVLILGLTFKENCPDVRNTRVVDIIGALNEYSIDVEVHDPWVDKKAVGQMSNVVMVDEIHDGSYDAVIIAVKHKLFIEAGVAKIRQFCKAGGLVYDLKSAFDKTESDMRL